jgi:HTH-type transcriptional regulator/antitoxin HipB
MKSKSPRKDSKTISKGLPGRKKKYAPYHEVDLDAKITELVSRSEEARESHELFETTFALVRTLIELRDKAGLSQKELAREMGVSQQMVSKMENSNYEGRTIAKLWRHVNALGYRPVIKFEPIEKWRKKHPIPGLAEKE